MSEHFSDDGVTTRCGLSVKRSWVIQRGVAQPVVSAAGLGLSVSVEEATCLRCRFEPCAIGTLEAWLAHEAHKKRGVFSEEKSIGLFDPEKHCAYCRKMFEKRSSLYNLPGELLEACGLCGHPISSHTDLVHDWEHGCIFGLTDERQACLCSGHVECVGCRRVVWKPFFKPEKCDGCGCVEFENA